MVPWTHHTKLSQRVFQASQAPYRPMWYNAERYVLDGDGVDFAARQIIRFQQRRRPRRLYKCLVAGAGVHLRPTSPQHLSLSILPIIDNPTKIVTLCDIDQIYQQSIDS